jgi:thiol:disulfide interchange protein DsbA
VPRNLPGKRKGDTMKLFKLMGYAAVLLALFGASNGMAQQAPVAGRDYQMIKPPQPTSGGNKIEIIEFFWYGCPHCYHLEPSLNAWLKKKPADVEFRPVPGTFGAKTWEPLTRTYYALDAMGLATKYHYALFTAIHRESAGSQQQALVTDYKVIADWLGGKGVDKKKFLEMYNSFSVESLTKRSEEMTRNYDVSGTPALAIDGRYLISPSSFANPDNSLSYERFFNAVDQLIAQVRKERGARK